jgi:hypothetical protein
MGYWTTEAIPATGIYNAQVTGTKAEVTDNPNSDIWMIDITNTTAAAAYLQIFDADADNVTVGTTTPTFTIGLAANQSKNIVLPKPIRLATGFTVASTTTRTGAVSAAQEVTIAYATYA